MGIPRGPTPRPYLTGEFGGLASSTILARRLPWTRRIRASISFFGIIPSLFQVGKGKLEKFPVHFLSILGKRDKFFHPPVLSGEDVV